MVGRKPIHIPVAGLVRSKQLLTGTVRNILNFHLDIFRVVRGPIDIAGVHTLAGHLAAIGSGNLAGRSDRRLVCHHADAEKHEPDIFIAGRLVRQRSRGIYNAGQIAHIS
jgi:hypothetical protein